MSYLTLTSDNKKRILITFLLYMCSLELSINYRTKFSLFFFSNFCLNSSWTFLLTNSSIIVIRFHFSCFFLFLPLSLSLSVFAVWHIFGSGWNPLGTFALYYTSNNRQCSILLHVKKKKKKIKIIVKGKMKRNRKKPCHSYKFVMNLPIYHTRTTLYLPLSETRRNFCSCNDLFKMHRQPIENNEETKKIIAKDKKLKKKTNFLGCKSVLVCTFTSSGYCFPVRASIAFCWFYVEAW